MFKPSAADIAGGGDIAPKFYPVAVAIWIALLRGNDGGPRSGAVPQQPAM